MRNKKNWKRLIALAISAAMLVPAQASYAAGGAAESGTETYAESREADANGFVIDEDGVLTGYTGDAENVVIPDNVTSIGDYAFSSRLNVKSIYIPKGVRKVSQSAFAIADFSIIWSDGSVSTSYSSLENLEAASDNPYFSSEDGVLYDKNKETLICCPSAKKGSFVVPDGVSTIAARAFESCQLTSIELPAGVTKIRDTYFCRGCSNLTELKVAAENQNYSSEDGILYDKDKKTLLTCPSGKLGNLEIPAGVTSIAGFAFATCFKLSNIRIPSSVTSIGEATFSSVRSITVPAEVSSIGMNAFSSGTTIYGKEGSYAQTYAAENEIKFSTEQPGFEIKDGVLVNYSGMDTEVVIPTGVTSIGDAAFYRYRGLTSVTIPSGVTSIGDAAFSSCYELESVNISAGVTSIGTGAFWACSSLTDITIPEGVTSIGNNAFMSCISLTEITIPASVTSIGDAAFYRCSSLTKITIPESVTSIGMDVFHNRNEDLTIYGKSGSVAETYAKENNINFSSTGTTSQTTEEKTLSDKDVTISQTSYAYDGTAKKPAVTVKVENISLKEGTDYTVEYKNNINAGTATVTVTGKGNYKGTITKSFSIEVQKGTSHIAGAYKYQVTDAAAVSVTAISNAKTTKVKVPKTVTIGGKNFSVTAIEKNAFKKNTKITSVEIGDNVKTIGASAFEGCTKLTKITVGKGVTEIGSNAFKSCKKLGTITIKSTSLKKVGKNALKGIKATAKVKVPSKKLSAYKKLFKSKGQGKKVKITK